MILLVFDSFRLHKVVLLLHNIMKMHIFKIKEDVNCEMKDNENLHWELKEIAQAYKVENSEWTWKKCLDKAKIIYKELNKLNYNTLSNDRLFFKFNTPFSFYFDRDDEFGSIYETRNE